MADNIIISFTCPRMLFSVRVDELFGDCVACSLISWWL